MITTRMEPIVMWFHISPKAKSNKAMRAAGLSKVCQLSPDPEAPDALVQ